MKYIDVLQPGVVDREGKSSLLYAAVNGAVHTSIDRYRVGRQSFRAFFGSGAVQQ